MHWSGPHVDDSRRASNLKVKVGIIQVATKRLDLEANYARAKILIKKAADRGARIVCTPECMLDGYAFDKPAFQEEPGRYCVDPANSVYTRGFMDLAKALGIYIIACMSAMDGTARRNAAIVYNPDGTEGGRYFKVHSTHGNKEATFYKHGEQYPVFHADIDGGDVPFGVMICYDRQLPEPARILRVNGAKIIFNPAATGNFAMGWNTRLMQTRAYENKCYVVSVNHAWPRINGMSLACSPAGKVIARCMPWETVKVVSLTMDDVERKAKDIKTRRPTTYNDLLKK